LNEFLSGELHAEEPERQRHLLAVPGRVRWSALQAEAGAGALLPGSAAARHKTRHAAHIVWFTEQKKLKIFQKLTEILVNVTCHKRSFARN
jgi:hypothetical protein